MSKLGAVVEAVEKHERFVLEQVKRARSDEKFGREMMERWNKIKAEIPISRAPTGLQLPRLALPEIDEPGEIARYLFGDGLPGEFPYLNGAYREMYLEPLQEIETGSYGNGNGRTDERPQKERRESQMAPSQRCSRRKNRRVLFSGLMLAEDTNKRFHFLSAHQRSKRLSTAFDGPTLYGIDQRRRRRFRKNRRRRRRGRHRRRHGAALRRLRCRRAEFFRVDDDQRPGADHHGDVYRGGETSLRFESGAESPRHDSGRHFQGSSGAERNHLSRPKRRSVFSAT